VKLPLWRTLLGFGVLGGLLALLVSLIPIYLDNYRLTQFLRDSGMAASEESARTAIVKRAGELGLPVAGRDIRFERAGERMRADVRYIVEVNLGVGRIDLHLHAGSQ